MWQEIVLGKWHVGAGRGSGRLLPGASTSQLLVVDTFKLVQDAAYYLASSWYYAPQLAITTLAGAGSIDFLSLTIEWPTTPETALRTSSCSSAHFAEGERRQLFPEIYGDYVLTFDSSWYSPAPDSVSALLVYRDRAGRHYELPFRGAIVQGDLPTTYTGGVPAFIWTAACR